MTLNSLLESAAIKPAAALLRIAALLLVLAVSTTTGAERLVISTFAGTGVKGFFGDGGSAQKAQLNGPTGVARGPDGALYICDTANNRIRKVTPDGEISTIAGTGAPGWSGDGGPGAQATLKEPYEVRFDAGGNVFWVERGNHTVRKYEAKTRIVTTVAGNGTAGFSGDGGPASQAQLNEPHSIGFDKTGSLYICDVKNHRIRKVNMETGQISTFAGTGETLAARDGASLGNTPLFGPRALDFDRSGNIWLALREGNAVYKLDLVSSTIHHIAGTGKNGFEGNGGPARQATLSGPKGLSVAPSGNIYVADTESHSIRRINPLGGTIHLTAGTGISGGGADGDPLNCQLARPHGIFVDNDGSIFIGDTDSHRVRVIRASKE